MLNSFEYYGASKLVGMKDCWLKHPVSWTHGIPWGNYNWRQILAPGDEEASIHLVRSINEKIILERQFPGSIINVVGLPIVYVEAENFYLYTNRLFVPGHSISGLDIFTENINELVVATKKRDCDAIMLPYNRFCKLFKVHKPWVTIDGIRFLSGASLFSGGSLERVVNILKSTGTVVTNVLGSHIYYAGAYSVRIEFLMNEIQWYTPAQVDSAVLKYPHSFREPMREYFEDRESKMHELNFILSLSNEKFRDYARNKVGFHHKKNIQELVLKNLRPQDYIKYNLLYSGKRALYKVQQFCEI